LSELQSRQEETRINELPIGDQPVARQFAKGGPLPQFQGPGLLGQFLAPGTAPTLADPLGTTSVGGFQQQQLGPGFGQSTGFNLGSNSGSFLNSVGEGVGNLLGGGQEGFQSRVPWFGAAAQGIGSLLGNRQVDFAELPEFDVPDVEAPQVAPNLVDFTRGRQKIGRERDIANQVIRRQAKGTGSKSALLENVLAGATGTQRIAGEGIEESIENQGNINAQIRNQAAQFNAQQEAQARAINARNKLFGAQFGQQNALIGRENELINQQRRDSQIGGLTSAVTGYGRDLMAANQYDQMIDIIGGNNPNYQITQGPDSPFRRLFQITRDAKINFRNTDDTALNTR
jgi:hypothetical protein